MAPKVVHEHPDRAEIQAALEAVTGSAAFSKSGQLASFLRFVVEETLEGRGDRIKAYTIATTALGRDENFDPQSDPIVRVEAGRLRRALQAYYKCEGAADAIRIELPVGSYVPVFRANPDRWPLGRRMADVIDHLVAFVRANPRQVLIIAIAAGFTAIVTFELIGVLSDALLPLVAALLQPPSAVTTGGIGR